MKGVSNFRSPGEETQKIAMKFGMLVIGQGENAVSTDELAQRKKFS